MSIRHWSHGKENTCCAPEPLEGQWLSATKSHTVFSTWQNNIGWVDTVASGDICEFVFQTYIAVANLGLKIPECKR